MPTANTDAGGVDLLILTKLMRESNNWGGGRNPIRRPGTYVITGGAIALDFLKPGQYYRILGSVFNDGVYRYGAESDLMDETFEGGIWALFVTRDFIADAQEIATWETKYGDSAVSPFTMESFGGYSYQKAVRDGTSGGGWESALTSMIRRWRKL